MKKLLLSLAVIATGFTASAQISTGTIAVGGELFFESQPSPAGSVFGLGVNGGYFLMDGLELMANLSFTGEDKAGTRGGNKSAMGIAVGAAKYFSLADKFYLTGGAAVGFNSTDPGTGSVTTISLAAGPGFAWFPADKWGISLSMGNWIYLNNNSAGTSFGITPNLGGLGLGVRYFLTK